AAGRCAGVGLGSRLGEPRPPGSGACPDPRDPEGTERGRGGQRDRSRAVAARAETIPREREQFAERLQSRVYCRHPIGMASPPVLHNVRGHRGCAMTRRWARLACAGLCVAAVVGVALYRNTPAGAGTQPDLKPTAHWVFDADGMTGNKVADRCGRLPATVIGSPKLIAATPTPRLEFAGPDDGVVVQEKVTPDAEFLPKAALSVVARGRLDEGTEGGETLGCLQDNAPAESGFILGYNKTSFYFCLATKGAARAPTREIAERPSAEGAERGDGKLTYLAGK